MNSDESLYVRIGLELVSSSLTLVHIPILQKQTAVREIDVLKNMPKICPTLSTNHDHELNHKFDYPSYADKTVQYCFQILQ